MLKIDHVCCHVTVLTVLCYQYNNVVANWDCFEHFPCQCLQGQDLRVSCQTAAHILHKPSNSLYIFDIFHVCLLFVFDFVTSLVHAVLVPADYQFLDVRVSLNASQRRVLK